MDLLSSLFWADETWLSAKPPFKVVTKHQPPNRPWLHMSHVASWHQVGCRHPDHSASLWWPLPGRKWNRCGWNGGGGGVFRCWLFWSVSRSKLKETQKNMLYTFPKLEMCFSKNPLFLKLRFFLFTTTRSKPPAEILFMSGYFLQSTPETSEDLVLEFDQL